MAKSSKFIKTKSNYVLKDLHQTAENGAIFERDYMTISGLDGMSPIEEQTYGVSNFKFVVRAGLNQQKKHTNGRWISDCELSGDTVGEISKDSKIVFNSDYESMLDFAYYGSAVDLVRATVTEVIMKFPAELYFTREVVKVPGKPGPYYLVSNDFAIDMLTEGVEVGDTDNIMRYFLASYGNYIITSDISVIATCINDVTVSRTSANCVTTSSGDIIANVSIKIPDSNDVIEIAVYQVGDEIYLLYTTPVKFAGYHIRPNADIVEAFYDNLSDFGKVLLDRQSKPKYTATFNTPFESESGYFTFKQRYTWPSTYGWNPDINTPGYQNYLRRLIELATFHDEYDSDNIWRSMTHEGIKNLDWTFTRIRDDQVDVFESIDTTKVEPILKIYGRQYDDLKRAADVVARSGNVTYDKKSNVPDYFLEDVLQLSGWETVSVNPTDNNTFITGPLYSGETRGYTGIDANNEFLRRLKINSAYLFSMKGTRQGLVSLLSIFGMKENADYKITEYVGLADGTYPLYDEVVAFNEGKFNTSGLNTDPLSGIPVATPPRGVPANKEPYVVPWYERGKKYDADLYFQMKGGWAKSDKKRIHLPHLVGEDLKYIHESENFKLYEDTISDLKYVGTLDDLVELGRSIVKTGDVCYVTNISGIIDKYLMAPEDNIIDFEDASHYFYLMNDEYANVLGYNENAQQEEKHGWVCVTNAEISAATSDIALKILYLESIVDNTEGNNPHMGHGMYDAGEEYIDRLFKPFGPAMEEDEFITMSIDEAREEAERLSFNKTIVEDNRKCLYFADRIGRKYGDPLKELQLNEYQYGLVPVTGCTDLTGVSFTHNIGKKDGSSDSDAYINYRPYNPEEGNPDNDMSAANSIVNLKHLKIEFYPNGLDDNGKNEYTDYITNKILFYLKQMIPTTTIFEYTIGGTGGSAANNVN